MKIVCFSEIQWKYVRTRKQQILSRFPEDWEILFLSTVVAGKRNNFFPQREGRILHLCVPVIKNLPQRSLRFLFSLSPTRFIWNVFVCLWVKIVVLLTGFGGSNRVFYVSNIYYANILPWLPRSLMIYDCNDDPMSFPGTPDWAEKYFLKLASDADLVVAVSMGLIRKLKSIGIEEPHHIPNGVDYDLFTRAASRETPEEMRKLPTPILGYTGAISDWFDMDLVERISDAFPGSSIVLIGPLFDSIRERFKKLLDERSNIHYLGPKPYQSLGSYVGSFDVSLIPLKVIDLRKFADPNKLYEYSSVGKPIVTMLFSEEMRKYSDFIHLAESEEEFIDGIRTALEKGADGKRMREFAMASSWKKRADAMSDLILQRLKRGS